jgi:hypothetical protein
MSNKQESKMTEYETVGPDFLNDNTKTGIVRVHMPMAAKAVFEALKTEEAWKAMLPIDRAEWHGPLGPDTSRSIGAKDAVMLEQFFEWEEGRSFGFRLERGTVGFLKAMAERYEVIPTSDTTSDVQLTYRIQTKGMAAPLAPLLMGVFKIAGKKSMKKLAAYIAKA